MFSVDDPLRRRGLYNVPKISRHNPLSESAFPR
jgi:hypothetical protein